MVTTFSIRAISALAIVATLAGCGGFGGSGSVPRAAAMRLSVDWPQASRATTTFAKSLRVTLSINGTPVAEKLLSRPNDASTSEVTFNDLPAGEALTKATVYAEENAAGDPIGSAEFSANLVRGTTVTEFAALSVDGSIAKIDRPSTGTGNLVVGLQ